MNKKTTTRTSPVQQEASTQPSFPIVGIGASAGGMEAFAELLKHLPLDTGMGFVLVQHLDPVHDSALTHILSKSTALPVREVIDDEPVRPDHVYIIPPNTLLSIERGVLKLAARGEGRAPNRAVDHFFESLAQDVHERAIGVVLSGTASDGTLGLEAIRAGGGFTFAQDDTAKYNSMPRSAVAAGCVDLVLSPRKIAEELAWIAHHPLATEGTRQERAEEHAKNEDLESGEMERSEATTHEDDDSALPSGGMGSPPTGANRAKAEAKKRSAPTSEEEKQDDVLYKKIMVLLHNHSGVDFSLYKSSTIRRRISRRIVLSRLGTMEAYVTFLRGNGKELDALYSDVLISVTSFFRNPEAFEFLKKSVFPKLIPTKRNDPMRVWVLGCSTGQEAYSLGMAFHEFTSDHPRPPKLQIFATDLNETLLEKARAGLYAKSIVNDIAPERLRRFFVEEDGGYRVIKSLRESIVFARQNMLNDPPFSRMDLISCRNLLIYIEPALQQKVIPVFHYALRPNGCLFLGASESIGTFNDLFEPLDRRHKIFTRKAGPSPPLHPRSSSTTLPARALFAKPTPAQPESFRPEMNAQREADRVTRNRYAPPSVLVNADLLVLEFRGDTSPYLKPPIGQASFQLLKMAREGLTLPLRNALNKARRDNTSVRKDNVRINSNGQAFNANVEIVPLKNVKEQCFLVFFEPVAQDGEAVAPTGKPTAGIRARATVTERNAHQLALRVAELENELAETRDYLQSLQEQQEAAGEELQASNEEVTSANEELQSINEELETSKEELESANEELTTTNDEMNSRNAELYRLNSDLINLQTSIRLSIILVGRDMTVRRFSAQAEKQFNLLATDVGRTLSSIRHDLVFVGKGVNPDLETFVEGVITDVREREHEVRDKLGHSYILRVRPYMTLDNKVDGAVLVLMDIDAIKRGEAGITAAQDYAEAIVRTMPGPVLVLDAGLTVLTANESFYNTFKVDAPGAEGRVLYELGNGQWDIPKLRDLLDNLLLRNGTIENYEVEHDFETIGHKVMVINARRLEEIAGHSPKILLGIVDITDREKASSATAQLAAIVTSSDDAIISKDLHGIIRTWNQGAERLYGYTAEEAIGRPATLLIPKDRLDEEPRIMQRVGEGGIVDHFETVALCKDGSLRDISTTLSPIRDPAGRITGIARSSHDISQRKQMEHALESVAAELLENDKRKNEFIAMLAHELRNPLAPVRAGLEVLDGMAGRNTGTMEVRSMIKRQVDHMVRLVDDLLDVSRVSRGKIMLHRQPIEIAPVVAQAIEAIRPNVEKAHQVLAVTLPELPIHVDGDPARLAQVVNNLLNNASKFTPRNGRISIIVEQENGYVLFRVSDNGVGLSAEQLPRIFNLFMQADTSLERSESGLGIGLTLVKNLVELHGGTVEALSPGLGKGSTFTVRLPILADAPEPDLSEPDPAQAPAPKNLRILVVDDNRDAADLSALLLRHMGHEVHIAYDGRAGVEAAEKYRPELILMDIGLPRLNGYDAARHIRKQPWGKDILMIALTGWGQDEDRQKSKEAGFDHHLVKPMQREDLKKLLFLKPEKR